MSCSKAWARGIVLIVPFFLLLLMSGETSAQFQLRNDVFSALGGVVSSTNQTLLAVCGQPQPIGTFSSAKYIMDPGFIPTSTSGVIANAELRPSVAESQGIGIEFVVDFTVYSVQGLFGISFELNFTNTHVIDVVTPYTHNVIPGDFLGSDVIFFQTVDEAAGKVNIGISRKTGQPSVDGTGVVARIKFKSLSSTTSGTKVLFSLKNVISADPAGNPILFKVSDATITLSGILVWPGDTNNDGVVNQTDILPLGLNWSRTGPPRSCHTKEAQWLAHNALPWNPVNATYVDANGDGTVNQTDVLPIGLHWGKTHSQLLAKNDAHFELQNQQLDSAMIMLKFVGNTNPNQDFFIDIVVQNAANLFGLSYELFYQPASFIDAVYSVTEGPQNLLGNDIIFFPLINRQAGIDTAQLSVGMSRKFGQSGMTADNGLVTRIAVHMAPSAMIDLSTTHFWFESIVANDPSGNHIPFKVDLTQLKLITDVQNNPAPRLPSEFVLCHNYPNPFNPKTTIEYEVLISGFVRLAVYNFLGQKIKTLIEQNQAAGIHRVVWDGKNEVNEAMSSGIYLYRMETSDFTATRPMVLIR